MKSLALKYIQIGNWLTEKRSRWISWNIMQILLLVLSISTIGWYTLIPVLAWNILAFLVVKEMFTI